MTASVWAQCHCSGCQQGGDVYSNVVEDGQCGRLSDWEKDPYYSCCRPTLYDQQICDPCCNAPYVSGFGGVTRIDNFFREVQTGTNPTVIDREGAELVDGYGLGLAVGYRVHQRARVELEYSYRFNKVANWFTSTETDGAITAFAAAPATGRVYSHSGMFNLLFDVTQRRVRCANLYGGAGIGVLTIDADITSGGTNYVSDDSRFAFQFIGGVNYPLLQRFELFTEYRYMGTNDLNVFDATGGTPFGDFDYDSHNVLVGIRVSR